MTQRKTVNFSFVLVVFLFGFPGMLFAQMNVNTVSITTNSKYPIEKMYIDNEFTIIGWSTDSKIAFVTYIEKTYYYNASNQRLSRDAYSSGVYIYDLIEDHYVDMLTVTKGDGSSANTGITFEEFWVLFEEEITAMLTKYNIRSFPNTEMRTMETLGINHHIEYFFQTAITEYYDEEYGVKRESEINNFVVKNNRNKTKIIDSAPFYNITYVLGYYKSPFEDRIVFYTKHKDRGFRGDPDTNRFIGCHLTAGFQ
jgi:hypothetical protein